MTTEFNIYLTQIDPEWTFGTINAVRRVTRVWTPMSCHPLQAERQRLIADVNKRFSCNT